MNNLEHRPTCLLPKQWWLKPLKTLSALSPVQWIQDDRLTEKGLKLAIKREDLLSPTMGGNKLYKLYYHLQAARAQDKKTLLSFGGAYSNHIYALAHVGLDAGLRTIGVIRGERPEKLSPTLQDAQACGMELLFVSREDYRAKDTPEYRTKLAKRFGDVYSIPEGAGDELGAKGCMVLGDSLFQIGACASKTVCLALGTGGTFAGVLASQLRLPNCNERRHLLGFSSLKLKQNTLPSYEQSLLKLAQGLVSTNNDKHDNGHYHIDHQYHFGGYAKYPGELHQFLTSFEQKYAIPLDPIYTAKMLYGLFQRVDRGAFNPGETLIVLHSGGLQGRRGYL